MLCPLRPCVPRIAQCTLGTARRALRRPRTFTRTAHTNHKARNLETLRPCRFCALCVREFVAGRTPRIVLSLVAGLCISCAGVNGCAVRVISASTNLHNNPAVRSQPVPIFPLPCGACCIESCSLYLSCCCIHHSEITIMFADIEAKSSSPSRKLADKNSAATIDNRSCTRPTSRVSFTCTCSTVSCFRVFLAFTLFRVFYIIHIQYILLIVFNITYAACRMDLNS